MNPSNYTAHVVGLEEALIHPTTTTRHASFTIISLLRSILRNKISNTFMWSWDWASLGYALVAWQLATIIWKFWWKSPSNLTIAAYPTLLGRCVTALHMIFDCETVIQRAYDSANGKPFAIPTIDRWIVFVSDRDQLKLLEREPETVLSMEKALHEIAFTSSILGGHQVPPEHSGPKSESFRVTAGVLKNQLRSNIPSMSGHLQARIRDTVELEFLNAEDGKSSDGGGWQRMRLWPAFLRIVTRINLWVLVGEEIANGSDVYGEVMSFYETCIWAFPIFMLMPNFLLPIVGPLVMGFGKTRQRVFNRLLCLVRPILHGKSSKDKQAASREQNGKTREVQGHITQWMVEMTRLKDAATVTKTVLGLLFASAFQIPVVAQFCVYTYCKHPEYHAELKAEAANCKDEDFGTLNKEMPCLDSFMKETARLNPGIVLSAPRAVMVPYTSKDGFQVPTGNWFAIPQLSVMRDEKFWPRASSFEAWRFVNKSNGSSTTRLTHPSHEFPFWGSMQHACPARFYVSAVMKMILSHLMTEYEFRLEDDGARPVVTFGNTRMPNPFMTILIRKAPKTAQAI